jgi:hypothetical protein
VQRTAQVEADGVVLMLDVSWQAEEDRKPVAPPVAPPVAAVVAAPRPPIQAGPRPGATQRAVGFAMIGVGGAGLVMGVVAGALVIAQHGSLVKICKDGTCPTSQAGALDTYHTKSLVSTLGFVGGAAVAGAGLVVVLTSRKQATAGVTPYLGLGTVGAQGRF